MIIEELIAILGYQTRGEADLRRFNRSIDETAKKLASFAAVAGAAVGAALGALANSVISTSAQFEGFSASLETVTGSADSAKSAMDWITKFAKTTPYEVAGITDAFIKLKTYGIDPLADDALRVLGDTASAMNKPLNQAVEALADATTFQFERLREFGLTASQAGDEVTFSWNKNGKELTQVVKKNGEEIRKFILDQLGDRFNGAMIRQSKTWNGMISNLGDEWTSFLLKIGGGGFFENVKGKLADLFDLLGRLDKDGSIDRWAQNLSDGFTSVADVVVSFAVRIARHFETINGIIERNREAWNVFKAVMLGVAIWLFPVIAIVALIGLAIDEFLTYLRGGDSLIGDFIDALARMRDALVQWLAELPGRITDGIRNAFQAGFDAARGVVDDFVSWASAKLSALNPANLFSGTSPMGDTSGSVSARPDQKNPILDEMLKNAEGHLKDWKGSPSASKVIPTTDNRNQSVNVGGVNVTVNGVGNVSKEVGAAVGAAAGQGAARGAILPPTRTLDNGAF